MNHAISHNQDLFLIIGTANRDDFSADPRSCDRTAFRSTVSGGDNDDKSSIPGGIDSADEDGIFAHISSGKRADRDIDDPNAKLFLMLANPAQTGEDIRGATASLTIEHFDRNQRASGGNSAKTPIGKTAISRNNSADVGAMSIVVIGQNSVP